MYEKSYDIYEQTFITYKQSSFYAQVLDLNSYALKVCRLANVMLRRHLTKIGQTLFLETKKQTGEHERPNQHILITY